MSGLPHPTRNRLMLADGIAAGEVHGYPGWVKPAAFWRPDQLCELKVTARVFELLDSVPPLAEWACEPRDAADKVPVRLTDDGRAWRARAKRCPACRCDPAQCEADDSGQHCADQSCGSCLHGCPLDNCRACS